MSVIIKSAGGREVSAVAGSSPCALFPAPLPATRWTPLPEQLLHLMSLQIGTRQYRHSIDMIVFKSIAVDLTQVVLKSFCPMLESILLQIMANSA